MCIQHRKRRGANIHETNAEPWGVAQVFGAVSEVRLNMMKKIKRFIVFPRLFISTYTSNANYVFYKYKSR